MKWLNLIVMTVLVPGLAYTSSPQKAETAANQSGPKFEEAVKIEFPKDGYTYTLAEAAKGIKIQYKIVVEQDYAGVIALRSFADPPGPSGLHPHEKISGNSNLYSLTEFGHGPPPTEVIKTIKKGTYLHSFDWDGRNWTGPSDTGRAKGKPFPAGTYDLTVTLLGKLVTDKAKASYEITRKTQLVLK